MSQPSYVQTTLDPATYLSADIFDREMGVIESKGWNYVGLTTDVPTRNSFITVTVGRRSVIVQRFEDGIRAFDNVCGHRGCRIRAAGSQGAGAIRCPYHSWTFGADGTPLVIPNNDQCFGISDSEKAQFRLHSWSVALCGELIFVRRSQEGESLEAYLDDLFEPLARMSGALGEEISSDAWEFEANWKLCIENTLDEYHANFVHPTTFRGLLSLGFTYEYQGRHSTMTTRASDEALRRWRKIEKMIASRPIADENYWHAVSFPLTTFASTFGATFSVQSFQPLSPSKTRFVSRLFITNGLVPANLKAVLGDSAVSFNRQVFAEDKEVCELMQQGVTQGQAEVVTGAFEQRIRRFQSAAADFFRE